MKVTPCYKLLPLPVMPPLFSLFTLCTLFSMFTLFSLYLPFTLFSCPSSSIPTLVSEWLTEWFMIINLSDRRVNARIWSDNLQLPCVQPPISSWSPWSSWLPGRRSVREIEMFKRFVLHLCLSTREFLISIEVLRYFQSPTSSIWDWNIGTTLCGIGIQTKWTHFEFDPK